MPSDALIQPWMSPVARYMGIGLLTTLQLAAVSGAGSIALGLILGVLLVCPWRAVTRLVQLYVELWRGLPVLISLFFVFFVLPVINIRVNDVVASAIGLILWGSANAAEIVRGAIRSISRAQFEAGAALGLNWRDTMTHVVVAQAVRRMIPPMMNLMTNLIQSTALAAVIGGLEILEAAQRSIARLTMETGSSHAAVVLGAVLVVFFVICAPLTHLSRRLEERLR